MEVSKVIWGLNAQQLKGKQMVRCSDAVTFIYLWFFHFPNLLRIMHHMDFEKWLTACLERALRAYLCETNSSTLKSGGNSTARCFFSALFCAPATGKKTNPLYQLIVAKLAFYSFLRSYLSILNYFIQALAITFKKYIIPPKKLRNLEATKKVVLKRYARSNNWWKNI